MKVLVAMDEFNGIISSYQANRYVEEAVASQIETADIVQVPLFNGRHELLNAVFLWRSGTRYRVDVHDANGDVVEAEYGITDEDMAVIEASTFLKGAHKPVVERSSFGLGEMIKDACTKGAKHIVVSVGGVDTYDGGAGMLQALGAHFYDDEGVLVDVTQGPTVLKYIRRVDLSDIIETLSQVRIQVMSDFDSHYYGKHSAIMQQYKQLGLTHEQAAEIDNLIWYFSEVFKNETQTAFGPIARGGAGGGIAAILSGLYQAEIVTSHQLVDQITHLETLIEQADLVVFGEGVNEKDHLLETTTMRIAELVTKHNKPSVVISATAEKFDHFETLGVTGMFNTFIDMPAPGQITDFKMGVQLRHYTVQALKLLAMDFPTVTNKN